MNTNAAKQRKGRQTQSRRSRPFDKSVMNEGIYTNPRLVHSTLLLVGCNVQVQVRNSGIYEGIFKTMSPTGSVVLEMAHKVDPSSPHDTIPSREMLINSLVFNLGDVVQITATAVDLDYANKESAADLSLTKCNNGAAIEKELQPWEAEGQEAALETLEKGSTSANGWDAEEMFSTNADKFDIKSSYDPNLSQYTTPLVKKDTKEYREREAQAARLAQEIEKSEEYNKRVALENGDGVDEEMLFSAVHRPGETNNNGAKYLPPHLRKPAGRPMHKGPGQSLPSGSQSPHTQSPSPHQQPSPVRNMPVSVSRQPQTSQRTTGQTAPVQVSVSTPIITSDDTDDKHKEEKRLTERQERGKAPEQKKFNTKGQEKLQELVDFRNKFNLIDNESKESGDRKTQPSPVQQAAVQTPANVNQIQQPSVPSSSSSSSLPSTSPMPSSLSNPIATQQSDHRHQQQQQPPPPPPPQQSAPAAHVHPTPVITTAVPQNKSVTTAVASAAGNLPTEKKEEGKHETDDDVKDKTGSTLNPNAKEFIPAAKTYRPQPGPVLTPPRGATQSPVIVPAPVCQLSYVMTNQQQMMPNPQAARMAPAKKATVSAQAAAATGQPLLQTPNPQYPVQPFNIQIAPTAQGAAMSQVFTQGVVPLPPNMRMVTQQVMQGATTPTEQISYQQGQPVFVHHNMNMVPSYMSGPPSGAGAVGSNQQAPQPHSMPSHMAPHHHATPPHSQTNHMSSQGATSAGHHNPSPVPQHNPTNHLPVQQQGHHQPTSATPQPQHIVYQHGGQHNPQQGGPGHPPLQPSPHTPTSPQNIYPPIQYSQPYSMQPHMSYNTSAAPQQAVYTVTHSHHHQHPQMGMMQQQSAQQHNMHQNNPGVNPQMQQTAVAATAPGAPQQHGPYQLNQLQQGHHLQGGPPLPGQAGPMNIMQQHMVPQNPQSYHHNQ